MAQSCEKGALLSASQDVTSLLDLDLPTLLSILSRLTDTKDRNSISLVCKAFTIERQTREHIRLRCTKEEIELVPSCFPAVTSLDLSGVTPCKSERAYSSSFSAAQLAVLARSFPKVETLTVFANGVAAWITGGWLPFLEHWPGSLQTVIVTDPQAEYLGEFSFQEGPLILSELQKPTGLLAVKELHLHVLEKRRHLNGLRKLNISSLKALGLDFEDASDREELTGFLKFASSKRFEALEHLEIKETEDDGVIVNEHNLGVLLKRSSNLRSLSLELAVGYEVSTIPLSKTVAANLNFLSLNLSGFGEPFDLSPVLQCTSLEHFELRADSMWEELEEIEELVVPLVKRCRSLQSLKLGLWQSEGVRGAELAMLDYSELIQKIAGSAPPSLTEFHLLSAIPYHPWEGSLLQPFEPLASKLTRLCCKFEWIERGQKIRVTGWESLTELDLRGAQGCDVPAYETIKLIIDCPSLCKLKLTVPFTYTKISFVGPHPRLAALEIHTLPHYKENLASLLGSTQDLSNLTELSIVSLAPSDTCWVTSPEIAKAITSLTTLRRLSFVAQRRGKSTSLASCEYKAEDFDRFLALSNLIELQVPFGNEDALADFYKKLYGH